MWGAMTRKEEIFFREVKKKRPLKDQTEICYRTSGTSKKPRTRPGDCKIYKKSGNRHDRFGNLKATHIRE